ncbi:hypothetical protein VCV18_011678 [Metarhizium anisopliae]
MSQLTLSQPHHKSLSSSAQEDATALDLLDIGHILAFAEQAVADEPYALISMNNKMEPEEHFDFLLS